MIKFYEALICFLNREEIPYSRCQIDTLTFIVDGVREHDRFRFRAVVEEECHRIIVLGYFPVTIPKDNLYAVAAFINLINTDFVPSAFVLDNKSGSLRYRTCLSSRDINLTMENAPEHIKILIDTSVRMLTRAFQPILAMLFGDITVEKAYEKFASCNNHNNKKRIASEKFEEFLRYSLN